MPVVTRAQCQSVLDQTSGSRLQVGSSGALNSASCPTTGEMSLDKLPLELLVQVSKIVRPPFGRTTASLNYSSAQETGLEGSFTCL